jgi:hypothetical protein
MSTSLNLVDANEMHIFLFLWLEVQSTAPLTTESDKFRWRRTANGALQRKLGIPMLIPGSIQAGFANLLWKSWAPLKEKIFTWLALRNRWTGNRLSRRRLPGPARCLLGDQRIETLDHLMVQCPLARSLWFSILGEVGRGQFVPQPDSKFREWWCSLNACQSKERRMELGTRCIAVCRHLWLERNNIIIFFAESKKALRLDALIEKRVIYCQKKKRELFKKIQAQAS